MRYFGGKSRIAKHLAPIIDSVRHPGQWVWDAFCGGLSMSVALRKKGPVWSTDANAALIHLYQAVQAGWVPPTEVSKEAWSEARALPDTDPMKAFCGIGCTRSARWFQGYASDPRGTRNRDGIPSNFAKGCALKLPNEVAGGHYRHVDFLSVEPQPCEAILYLDPPYAGCKPYEGAPPLDPARFADRVRGWARYTHVFISEYSLQIAEAECVWSKSQINTADPRHSEALERLYYLGPARGGAK